MPEMAVHDYVCSVCKERFSATDPPDDAPKTPPRPIEEMRDCVG